MLLGLRISWHQLERIHDQRKYDDQRAVLEILYLDAISLSRKRAAESMPHDAPSSSYLLF